MIALAIDCRRLYALMSAQERTVGEMREIWKSHENELRKKMRAMAAAKWPELNRAKGG